MLAVVTWGWVAVAAGAQEGAVECHRLEGEAQSPAPHFPQVRVCSGAGFTVQVGTTRALWYRCLPFTDGVRPWLSCLLVV